VTRLMNERTGGQRTQPLFMHPVVFISSAVALGVLFAGQEWMYMRQWNYPIHAALLMKVWGVQYFLWGVVCWLLWWRFGARIQRANAFWKRSM